MNKSKQKQGSMFLTYTVVIHCEPQKGDGTFVIVTLENLGRFL